MFTFQDDVTVSTIDILSWAFRHSTAESKHRSRPIWVDAYNSSKCVDAGTAEKTVRQLICGLRCRGLRQGDVVCVHSFNNVWYPAIYLAIIGAGAIFVGSNPAYKSSELKHLFTSSRARFLIVERNQVDHVLLTAAEASISHERIFILDDDLTAPRTSIRPTQDQSTIHESWQGLLKYGESDWISFNDIRRSQSTAAVYLSSSGTTGLPKIVVMSHYAIVTQLVLADFQVKDSPYDVRRLITLPFFHSFALPFPILSLHRHETLFIMPRFSAEDCLTFIDRYKITMMPLVPPIAEALFGDSQSSSTGGEFASLTEIISAGAPMNSDMQRRLATRLARTTRLTQLWGMSELGWLTTFRYPESDLSGSVGRLLPNISAKLVDEAGSEVQDKTQAAEVWIRSPGLMMGYLDNEAATKDILAEGGWLKTGDIARCKDGKWYIVDRAKDMIKVRAWQVSPVEIESCLLTHPRITDAAVIGIPDELSGEKVLAFVVTADTTEQGPNVAADIQAFVAEQLASYKALSGGVMFVDEIPRGPSGKILRRVLRQAHITN